MNTQTSSENTRPRLIVKNFVEKLKPGTVLDLGCGSGNELVFLAEQGFEIIAVDKNSIVLGEALKKIEAKNLKSKVRLIEDNAITFAKYANEDCSFDNIMSLLTFHFLPKADAYFMYDWIKKHTAPGGLNTVKDFMNQGELPESKSDTQLFLKEGELKEIYKDWEVLHYLEAEGRTHTKQLQKSAEIVARKSNQTKN